MGAGAGQAIEDGWILGRTLGEYTHGTDPEQFGTLAKCASFYQDFRLPRAQKVQQQSRESGATYGMMTPDMLELSVDDCVPIVAEKTRERLNFVWNVELDVLYDNAKGRVKGTANGASNGATNGSTNGAKNGTPTAA